MSFTLMEEWTNTMSGFGGTENQHEQWEVARDSEKYGFGAQCK